MGTISSSNHPTRKAIAISFLNLASSGNVRDACEKHIAPDFRHHNPYFKGDAESLMKGMAENAAKFPNKIFEIQRVLEDGDLVAIHSRVKLNPEDRGIALVHIFRFQGHDIVELWDLGQPVPENSPNQFGMF